MTSANCHYIALHARLQVVVIKVWERGQKVKCQSALSWNTESNDGACVLEELSRCGGVECQTRDSTKSKSFLSWNLKQTDVDRQTTSSFQGEETQTLKEAIFLTAGHSKRLRSQWNREPDSQRLLGNLVFLLFSHIHHYGCITLLLSLAFELLISLFFKMTLAGSMCSVPLSLRMEVSYPPLSSSGSVEVDITLTAVTALL